MPKRARAKVIRAVEVPVFYIRLSSSIRILFDYSSDGPKIEIRVLCVSDKKDFQDKLKRSAEHIVHASSFDRLDWDDKNTEQLTLEDCTISQLKDLETKARVRFSELPPKEQEEGWTGQDYIARAKRATIYDFVIPNVVNYDVLSQIQDFELPAILKLQEHQKELMHYDNNQFLLEGVAGTGKTTILIYRFVNDIKNSKSENTSPEKEILFVTHNDRLKKDIVQSLKLFFPENEHESVSKCIKTVKELFMSNIENKNAFPPKEELTRRRFRTFFDRHDVDLDLFWEEYRGILRGYNLRGTSDLVTTEEYTEIGRRRGRIPKEQREDFYDLAKDAVQGGSTSTAAQDSWDSLDLCRSVFNRITQNEELRSVQCLYIDEVQDLTRAEMEVLLTLLKPNGLRRFAVAGDLSQSIQPSSFTWQALSDLVYEVLDLRISKHETLVENFRSTPYLVDAANHILSLQGELDNEGTPSLQRPYAGENTGEPGLIFFAEELELIDLLNKNDLPNVGCPMLVRDEATRTSLCKMIKNHSYIITIAQFKGLERRNILLWAPDSGSEGILDLRSNPIRGERAREREFSNSTALLELRHVFVAFTRARYLMGILAPENNLSYFMKDVMEKTSAVTEALTEKLELFSEELSEEALLEYANEYMNAELYEMAAEAFRNSGDEHNYSFCKGQQAIEDQRYDDAIHHLYQAAVEKTGENSELSGTLISEITDLALDSTSVEKQPTTLAMILAGARGMPANTRFRLEAERDEERGKWFDAAKKYVKSGNLARAKFCVRNVEGKNRQTMLYIECGAMKEATKSLKEYVSVNINKKMAVELALAKRSAINSILKGPLKPLQSEFKSPDINWARDLAKNDQQLKAMVAKEVQSKILDRENSTRTQEVEVLTLLKKTKNFAEIKNRIKSKKWKFIADEAYIDLKIMEMELGSALRHALSLESPKARDGFIQKICKSGAHKNEMINLYHLLKVEGIVFQLEDEKLEPYASSAYIVSLVAEASSKDSSEYPALMSKIKTIIETKRGPLGKFSTKWYCALINYLVNEDGERVTDELYYSAMLLWGIYGEKVNVDYKTRLIFRLIFTSSLAVSPEVQTLASKLVTSLKLDDRRNLYLYFIYGEKHLPSKLPNFIEANREEFEEMKTMLRIMSLPAEIQGECKNYVKEQKKLAKKNNFNRLEFDDMKFKNIKPKELRKVFLQDEIQYLLGLKQPKQIMKEEKTKAVQDKIPEKTHSSQQTTPRKPEPKKDSVQAPSDEDAQQDEHAPLTIQTPETIPLEGGQNTFDTSGFEIDYDEEVITLYPESFWPDLIETDSNMHIQEIRKLIALGEDTDPMKFRLHLLSFLDEALPPNENGLDPHLKLAIILAVTALADELGKKSGINNPIPESSLELIRLFKASKTTEILASKTAYSMRVL